MSFDWEKVRESKEAFRRKLAAKPIAEKLRLLDALHERAVAIRGARFREAGKDVLISQLPVAPESNEGGPTINSVKKRGSHGAFTLSTILKKMRDYINASGSVDREHLEADNVLGPIYKSFGEELLSLIEELNLTLAA